MAAGPVPGDSIARRRAILRRIAGASAVAGVAATPLSALASASIRPWCKNKTAGTNVNASVSAVASVILSTTPASQKFGQAGTYFTLATNVYASTDTFASMFGVTSGYDSKGVQFGATGCLLNLLCSQLLTATYASTAEYHWLTALCNARLTQNNVPNTFPYLPSAVKAYYVAKSSAALSFFTNYMESGA
ncbi:MAG: hypothetical protein KGL18_11915 [Burkholderiales bacterium]|nr:hypothetical protein [Burkholderiales bacterium]MDE2503662.1 hypothetical protein [Burkholderiales bacterium]